MTQEEWEEKIPRFIREAFNSLRQDPENDPEGTTFALSVVKVDGEPLWGIIAIMDPPEGNEKLVIPIFTAIPKGKKVSYAGHEAEDATDKIHEAFDNPDFTEVVDKLETDHKADPRRMKPYVTIASADGEDFNTFVYGELLEDPEMYGLLLMDTIHTLAQSYQDANNAKSSAPYMQQIMHGLLMELESPTTDINVEKKEDFH
jgi:hypothetical protein